MLNKSVLVRLHFSESVDLLSDELLLLVYIGLYLIEKHILSLSPVLSECLQSIIERFNILRLA
jgi:hypothetical protein